MAIGGMGLLAPTACESSPQFSGGSENPLSGCKSSKDCPSGTYCSEDNECETSCPSCGKSCEKTDDCPTGQFCDANDTCQQECEPSTDADEVCGSRSSCSEDGRCVADSNVQLNTGGEGGVSDMGEGGAQGCIEVEVEFEPQVPNVVLLIDKSGSMEGGNGFDQLVQEAIDDEVYEAWDCPSSEIGWRWHVVRNVLFHPENGVVKQLEDKVRFGYASYTSDNGFDTGTCPLLEQVAIDFGTHEEMLDEHACSEIEAGADTPTRESLTAVAESLAELDVDGPKLIVLATDGAPDTCTCSDWTANFGEGDECDDSTTIEVDGQQLSPSQAEQINVVLEAQRIHEELGITIEVINVSDPNSQALAAHLDDVAERGGAASGESIPGFSPELLSGAFESIIDGVRSCVIDLDGKINEGKEDTGTVLLDRDPSNEVDFEEIEYNGEDGWVVNSPTQIELVGDACDTIKSGEHELDISFPCDSFVEIR